MTSFIVHFFLAFILFFSFSSIRFVLKSKRSISNIKPLILKRSSQFLRVSTAQMRYIRIDDVYMDLILYVSLRYKTTHHNRFDCENVSCCFHAVVPTMVVNTTPLPPSSPSLCFAFIKDKNTTLSVFCFFFSFHYLKRLQVLESINIISLV